MEKISIIMPAYNTELHIEKSIASVLNQTHQNIELIIINDGSVDNTEKIVLKMQKKDDRIKYFKIQNSGSAVARNVGLKNVEGEYIFFLDSDDYIENYLLETLLSKMLLYNCDIVGCSHVKIYSNKSIPEKTFLKEGFYDKKKMKTHIYPSLIADPSLTKGLVPKTMVTKLYKKDLIARNKIEFVPKMRMGQDTVFTKKCMFYAESFYYLPDIKGYNYVHNKTSRTQTYLNNAWEILKESNKQSMQLNQIFPEYKLETQIPYELVSNAMTSIVNVSLHENSVSKAEKINEIKNIVFDKDLQLALDKISFNELNLVRKIFATFMKRKKIYLLYLAIFLYKRK